LNSSRTVLCIELNFDMFILVKIVKATRTIGIKYINININHYFLSTSNIILEEKSISADDQSHPLRHLIPTKAVDTVMLYSFIKHHIMYYTVHLLVSKFS